MRPPDLHNRADAWLIENRRRQSPNYRPEQDASLVSYLLHCEWSHPFWSWYCITGIHLRPIAGWAPANKQFPEADHEISILSLDPAVIHDPDKLASGEQNIAWLSPPDLIHQIAGLTDSQVIQTVTSMVEAVVAGKIAPDVDYRERWKQLIDLTAQHLKEGRHRPQ